MNGSRPRNRNRLPLIILSFIFKNTLFIVEKTKTIFLFDFQTLKQLKNASLRYLNLGLLIAKATFAITCIHLSHFIILTVRRIMVKIYQSVQRNGKYHHESNPPTRRFCG